MAKLSSTFSGMPNNKSARKRILRQARLGTRAVPEQSNIGDALTAVSAPVRYREAFVREKENIDFFQALSNAWQARKDWRP